MKNKRFFKYLLLIPFLAVLTYGTALAQSVKVEASLQDFTIKIGDQTRLFLVVSQPKNERITFPKLQDTITHAVQIVSINKPDTVTDQQDKNRITVTQSYIITSFEPGVQNLPAFTFVTSGGTLKSNDLTLQVQTVKIDTTKAVYDIKKPLTVTYTFFDWLKDNWLLIVTALVVLAGIIATIYYLRKHKKAESVIKVKKPDIPIHTLAVNKLNDLKAKKLWQRGEVKQYHSELTDIIREYLEQRYQIKTYEKTTEEILSALNDKGIPAEYVKLLQRILSLADLVKFAKLNPLPQENEESINSAVDFVLTTRQNEKLLTEGGSTNGLI